MNPVRHVVAALACLVLATGCSGGAPAPAVPAPAAPAAAAAPAQDFCGALRTLATKTREIGSQNAISPAQYTEIGDEMAALVPLAPADAAAPLTTLADEYHKIGAGTSTLQKSASKLGAATVKLAETTTPKCAGS
ncbi:hypothetical protein ACQEVB_17795 [Pseudonocardia sp. CA-107938]|uniref:hypothetical protein n=1 Tax=Pseudonocardia sp. CA-107938 TaxID=3240021 RepID=UPI003D8A2025